MVARDLTADIALLAANDFAAGLFVLAGIVVTAVGTWLVARRTKSGKITDSDADTLWEESTAMRRELREQVDALRGEISELKAEKLAADIRWQERVDRLEVRIDHLNAQIRKLEKS